MRQQIEAERQRIHGSLQPISPEPSFPVMTVAMIVGTLGTLAFVLGH